MIEIGLADGTKLVLANPNADENDVVEAVKDAHGGAVTVRTDQGTYRVFADNVTYVRTITSE